MRFCFPSACESSSPKSGTNVRLDRELVGRFKEDSAGRRPHRRIQGHCEQNPRKDGGFGLTQNSSIVRTRSDSLEPKLGSGDRSCVRQIF